MTSEEQRLYDRVLATARARFSESRCSYLELDPGDGKGTVKLVVDGHVNRHTGMIDVLIRDSRGDLEALQTLATLMGIPSDGDGGCNDGP